MTDLELVKAMARALCRAIGVPENALTMTAGCDQEPTPCWQHQLKKAAAALAVARPEIERRLLESMETVSEGMLKAGGTCRPFAPPIAPGQVVTPGEIIAAGCWRAMLAAFRRERGI